MGRLLDAAGLAITAELLQVWTAGPAQPLTGPEAIGRIRQRAQEGPTGRAVEPAQIHQLVSAAKHLKIPQHGAIGGEGVDAAHRLPIADAAKASGVVVRSVDIHKRQATPLAIAAPQQADFPQAERTPPVIENGQLGSGTKGLR